MDDPRVDDEPGRPRWHGAHVDRGVSGSSTKARLQRCSTARPPAAPLHDCRRWARRGAPQLAGRAVEHRWRRALAELPETHLPTRAPRRRGLPGASSTRESPIARRKGRDPHVSQCILRKRVPVTMGNSPTESEYPHLYPQLRISSFCHIGRHSICHRH